MLCICFAGFANLAGGQAFGGKPAKITAAFSKLVDQMRASKPTMKIIVSFPWAIQSSFQCEFWMD